MLKLVVAIFENPTQITAFSGPVFFHYLKGTSHFTLLMYNDDEEKPKYSQLYECQTQENKDRVSSQQLSNGWRGLWSM